MKSPSGALAMLVVSCLALILASPGSAYGQASDTGPADSELSPAQGERTQAEDEPRECLERALAPGCQTVRVDAIVVEGLGRTKHYVVMRELLFEEGDYASMRQIEESITRLRNLGLFREVSWELVSHKIAGPEGMPPEANPKRPSRVLRVVVDERWTLLPAFLFLQGGGLTRAAIGARDINLLGRYLELGFQYDRLGYNDTFWQADGAANSFVLWLRDPRFLNTFTRAGLEAWSVRRLRTIYDEQGQAEGGFSVHRRMLAMRLQRELLWWLYAGASLELIDDSFSDDFIPDSIRQLQRQNFDGPPDGATAFILRGMMRFGRIDRDDFYYDGWSLSNHVGHSDKIWGADLRFTQIESILLWYKRIPLRGNLAARVRLGTTNAEQIQHIYFLGGLDRVRGYPDSRFRGSSYWTANAEYRVAPISGRWFAAQMVGFLDAGATSQDLFAVDRLQAASAGVGLRLISPKIYSLVMRFDYAWPLIGGQSGALSFGAQQFF